MFPENSSYQSEPMKDTFDRQTSDMISYFTVNDNCQLKICGDINPRTGDLNDFVRDENSKHLP